MRIFASGLLVIVAIGGVVTLTAQQKAAESHPDFSGAYERYGNVFGADAGAARRQDHPAAEPAGAAQAGTDEGISGPARGHS